MLRAASEFINISCVTFCVVSDHDNVLSVVRTVELSVKTNNDNDKDDHNGPGVTAHTDTDHSRVTNLHVCTNTLYHPVSTRHKYLNTTTQNTQLSFIVLKSLINAR